MASVQNALAVPMGNAPFPGSITQQQVQEVYQKYRKMQEQGVREDDPEFIKAHNLLKAITQQSANRKAQRARQEAMNQSSQAYHQGMQQPAANGSSGANGADVPGPFSTTATATRNGVVVAANGHGVTPASAAGDHPTGPKHASHPSGNFSSDQMNTLRNQILAFKFLSKSMPIPANVQALVFASHQTKRSPTPSQALAAARQTLEEASRPGRASADKSAVDGASDDATLESAASRPGYESFESPYDKLKSKNGHISISYADHALRHNRLMIPSLMPSGVDVERVRYEKEMLAYNRIKARMEELKLTSANFVQVDTGSAHLPVVDESLKLKAAIELKMLALLPKQRALRQQISRHLVHYDNLAQTANRSLYRQTKRQNLREARITEKLEKSQRDARESKEKKKQSDHLNAILVHGREIRENGMAQKARFVRYGRSMQLHHQHVEKEEQKRVERTAKQRLQALKANDEETYLKLLGQAKDSRISHLLKQTDGFLSQLAASVKQQQRSAADRYGAASLPEEDDPAASEDDGDEDSGPKVDYYQVAHRVKEEIHKQADLLVGGTLKEYQVKGLQWMISLYNNNLNGILADEMGLGKTIQTISLITYLIEKKRQNGPFLVIVPLSTLTNWNLEFEKWAPGVARIVYKGPPNSRKQQQAQIRYGNFQVLLTTYEYVIKDRPILSKIKWVHMIIDEGHRMKNAQSKLTVTLTTYYHTRFRLILTGTPLQNNLAELWAMLNFVLPTIFKSVKSFDEWFNTPFANTGGQDKMELTEEEQLLVIRRLHKVLRPFLLRRLKTDVEKDLPDKQETVIKCRFSSLQAKLYKQLVTHNRISVSDGKGGKTGMRGLSNMLMQLRKLCNHPFVFEQVEDQMNPDKSTNDLIWRTAGKFELLDRIMPKFHASGHRILMFFQMTQIMNIMEDFLRMRGMQYLRLDGATKSDDRSELLRVFNAPDSPYFCFLLSTRAGGLGLNLQTADTVIIFDSDWNPHQDLQAQDRAHRIGQKNEVRILRLISSNSVEEKILERAKFKLDMDGKVIQAGKFDNKSSNEEREALLRTLLETAEAAEQLAEQEEMDDDDLNQIMARSDDELLLFQKMDEERNQTATYGPGKKLPRLMGESELPDIYLQEDGPVTEEIEEIAGRGARERTRVKYDDGLTEEQWLMAVDDDEDTLEAAIARKNARIEKRQTNKDKRSRQDDGPETSPEPSRHSSEEPPKKRGRKSNGPKRKADEEAEETPVAKRKRGRASKVADTLPAGERNRLQKILNHVYQHLMDLEVDISADSDDEESPATRAIIDPFIKLVPKSQYPDYYQFITNPIAMENIQKKINRNEYQSLKEFRNDIRLLCNNARTYNEDGSVLFQDANDIEAACVAKLKQETANKPEFQDFDEAPSTAVGSSSGTPLPPASGGQTQKLKLTFNNGTAGDGGANGDTSAAASDHE